MSTMRTPQQIIADKAKQKRWRSTPHLKHCPCGNRAVKIEGSCPVCQECLDIEARMAHQSRGPFYEQRPRED